jgi:TRAP-type C4-dicarboxylate transport system permease small subunit
MRWFFKITDKLESVVRIVVILLLSGMVILIFSQVLFRYLLNHPLAWTEELSRHFMIWAALLGAAVAYRKKAHLGVDVLVVHFGLRWQEAVVWFVHLMSIFFSGFLVYFGISIVKKTMHQLSSALTIPMGYIYASIPVGAAIILVFAAEKLLERRGAAENSAPFINGNAAR